MSDFASDFTYCAESGESTSAKLRRVEQERDRLALVNAGLAADSQSISVQLTIARAELAEMREARDVCRDRLDLVRAELASANTELEQRRAFMADLTNQPHWCVARDGGRICQRCRAEITRGQAYELVALSLTQHVMCPEVTP